MARGVLLLGVPGSGKVFSPRRWAMRRAGPPCCWTLYSLYGSLVGSTEANVRQAPAHRRRDAQPCLLFIDEVEKGLSGVGGQGDSGVATRLFGTMLSWLADHESDVFFIATANDVSKLPAEFTRAERLDAIFFLDLPATSEKRLIWRMYRNQFGIDEAQPQPDDKDWTAAEIKSCCRLAALLDVSLVAAARTWCRLLLRPPSRSCVCGPGPVVVAWPPRRRVFTSRGTPTAKPGRARAARSQRHQLLLPSRSRRWGCRTLRGGPGRGPSLPTSRP